MKLGIDLGGTKTEIVALGDDGAVLLRERRASPADYEGVLATIADLVRDAEARLGAQGSIGIGICGLRCLFIIILTPILIGCVGAGISITRKWVSLWHFRLHTR